MENTATGLGAEAVVQGTALDSDIELEIAKLEARKAAIGRRNRPYYVFMSLAICGGIVVWLFGAQLFEHSALQGVGAENAPLFGLGTAAYFGMAIVLFSAFNSMRLASLEQDLDVLEAKKRILSRSANSAGELGNPPSYFDRLVDINITNLGAYYGLVKVHANNSFFVSVFAGFIGFMLVVTGLIVGLMDTKNAQDISRVSAASGIITEFIAGVFFYLYNKTVRQLKEYHDSLIRVQNILLSFKIVGDTKDESQRNSMMGLMMQCLIAVEPSKKTEASQDGSE